MSKFPRASGLILESGRRTQPDEVLVFRPRAVPAGVYRWRRTFASRIIEIRFPDGGYHEVC